jgi:hypothetical protein
MNCRWNNLEPIRIAQLRETLRAEASLKTPIFSARNRGFKCLDFCTASNDRSRVDFTRSPSHWLEDRELRIPARLESTYCGRNRRGLWPGAVGREADRYVPDFCTARNSRVYDLLRGRNRE